MNKFKKLTRAGSIFVCLAIAQLGGAARTANRAKKAQNVKIAVAQNDIGGTVSDANGAEAGVWVIAETADLPTKFRKIVVTDDRGRFLIPDLPKGNYKIWVRGYGLVDSTPVVSGPGKTLALQAVLAPDARAAAQVYPANYWYSLLQVPAASEFPFLRPERASTPQRGRRENGQASVLSGGIHNQAEWLFGMRTCTQCHQLGDKFTREIEPGLGTFDSTAAAWDRRLKSGQRGPLMSTALNQLPHDRALAMFSGWSDQVAAGALPPVPPRPQGVERNVVISEWEWGRGPADWVHDEMSTDKRNPTVNPRGLVYATSEGAGTIEVENPLTNESSFIDIPTRVDQKKSRRI